MEMASPSARIQALGQVKRLHPQPDSGVQIVLLAGPGPSVGQTSHVNLPVTDEWRAELGNTLIEQDGRLVRLTEF